MIKLWRVIRYEYTRHVLRKRFLFALLSVPGMVLVMLAVGFLLVSLEASDAPLGYVDHSGLLSNPLPPPGSGLSFRPVKLVAFQDEAVAQKALDAGRIQAYYVLPADYPETGRARMLYREKPGEISMDVLEDFVRINLLADQPAPVVKRLTEGTSFDVRSADGGREMSGAAWFNILVPFIAGLAFIFAIFTSSGYLMQAVVEEKENRTMEILVTSVSPTQIMAGKVLGIIGVGFTQLFVWIGGGVAAVWIAGFYFEGVRALRIEPDFLWVMLLVLFPSFVMISALMAAIGATVTEEREGQQVTGLITLPIMIPLWFAYQLMSNPNGPLAIALSFFPLTAPLTITLRAGFTNIPPGQLALNILILVLVALGSLWLAGRAFRLGMLRYGQRVTMGELLRWLTHSRRAG